ncbi:MAG TPA: hypothetical protein IAC17_09255 [Candidatus Faecousia faecipullorum]|nr:hypothetical protein [Candidatus Faecousia faecipullorum]
MLFRKKIEKSCSYCLYGAKLEDEAILCAKKGIRSAESFCRRFKYDPCKRIPPRHKPLDPSKYEDTDYSL